MRFFVSILTVLTLIAGISASAQQKLDRSVIPTAGKPPALRVPVWTKSTLANGAEFVVSEKHDLPLVSFAITAFAGWSTRISPESVALGFFVSLSVGITFGLYPALKAAALEPVDAMRYE